MYRFILLVLEVLTKRSYLRWVTFLKNSKLFLWDLFELMQIAVVHFHVLTQVSQCTWANVFRYVFRNELDRSESQIFNFCAPPNCFAKWLYEFHCYWQCVKVPVKPHSHKHQLLSQFSQSSVCNIVFLVLVFITLIANEIKHNFMFICHLCFLFCEMLVCSCSVPTFIKLS